MTSSITARRFWTVLLAIAGLSLIWRIVFILVWRDGIFIWGDAYFYHESGRQLAEGVGWVNPLEYNIDGTKTPAADHPPLYILFLGFWSWIGLPGPTAHMILTAIFISTPMVIMTALAAREFGGPRLGLIAGGLSAVYPNIWSWDGTVLSEILAMLFLSTTVYVVYRFWNRPSFSGAALMGLALSLATFSRAELLLMSVLVITPMTLLVKQWGWRTRLSALVIAGMTSAAVLAPWVAFNLSRFENPVYLSEGYQVTLATSTCDATYYGEFTGYWSITCPQEFLAEEGLTPDTLTSRSVLRSSWRSRSSTSRRTSLGCRRLSWCGGCASSGCGSRCSSPTSTHISRAVTSGSPELPRPRPTYSWRWRRRVS